MYPVTFRTADKRVVTQDSDDFSSSLDPFCSGPQALQSGDAGGEEMRLILCPIEEKYGESTNSVYDKDR